MNIPKHENLKLTLAYKLIKELKAPNRQLRRRSNAQQKQLERVIAEMT